MKTFFISVLVALALFFSTSATAQNALKAGPRIAGHIGSFEFSIGGEIEYELEVTDDITVAPQASINLFINGPNAYLIGVEARNYFADQTYGGIAFDIGPAQASGRWLDLLGTVGTKTDLLGGVEVFGQIGYSNYSIAVPFFGGRASAGFLTIGLGAHYLIN